MHHWSFTDSILIAAVVVLVVLSAFLAYAETAMVRTSKIRAAAMVDQRLHGAIRLAKLVEEPSKILNAILLVTLICQLVAATLLGVVADSVFGGFGVLIATIFEVLVIFLLGEALPKNLSVRDPDRAALRSAGLVSMVIRFPPIALLSAVVIRLAQAITSGDRSKSLLVSEEELLALADAAMEEEVIETNERELIHSVISFGDTVAREVMVPRPDVVAVAKDTSIDQTIVKVLEAGFSRIPVYDGSVDNVVGVVFAKDLLAARQGRRHDESVATIVRDAFFVPETMPASDLLKEMRSGRFHMAMVVDEYGSTTGLVTLEDLIEELVGDIADEYDVAVSDVIDKGDGFLEVAGSYPVDDLAEYLDTTLPEGDWDSVGGMIIGLLGHLPIAGERVEVGGHVFIAVEVTSRRIGKVAIEPAAVQDDPQDDG